MAGCAGMRRGDFRREQLRDWTLESILLGKTTTAYPADVCKVVTSWDARMSYFYSYQRSANGHAAYAMVCVRNAQLLLFCFARSASEGIVSRTDSAQWVGPKLLWR